MQIFNPVTSTCKYHLTDYDLNIKFKTLMYPIILLLLMGLKWILTQMSSNDVDKQWYVAAVDWPS